jgi:hypothetical protein
MLVKTPLEASLGARFGVELGLRDGLVPLTGRVAFVQRGEALKGEVATELGLEFLEVSVEALGALAGFIARELQSGPGEPAQPDDAPPVS